MQFEDDFTLSACKVQKASTLDLVLWPPAGKLIRVNLDIEASNTLARRLRSTSRIEFPLIGGDSFEVVRPSSAHSRTRNPDLQRAHFRAEGCRPLKGRVLLDYTG